MRTFSVGILRFGGPSGDVRSRTFRGEGLGEHGAHHARANLAEGVGSERRAVAESVVLPGDEHHAGGRARPAQTGR